jgi:hypothetical protein
LEVEESNKDPTDCIIIPKPSKKTKLSSSSSKVDLMSTSLVLLPSDNPTEDNSTESYEVESLSQFMGLSPSIKPTNSDLIDELCVYITMVDDVSSLE